MDRRLGTILILRHQADWERLSSTRHFAHAHKCNVCARGVGIERKMAELQLDAEESSTGGSSNLEILLVDEEPRKPQPFEWDSSSDEEVVAKPTRKTFTPTSTPQRFTKADARYSWVGWMYSVVRMCTRNPTSGCMACMLKCLQYRGRGGWNCIAIRGSGIHFWHVTSTKS